jgi:hypothetical protein
MTAPTFFTVVADYKSVVVDLASDVDADPQLGPITAKVTFTPVLAKGDVILATNASPRPTGYLAAPIVARIDADGRLKLRVEPDGDRDDFATTAAFPATGTTAKVYYAINTQTFYRWTGSAYAVTYPYAAVRLLADTPLLELDGDLYYKVSFSEVIFNGQNGYISPFVFQAPTTDTELNLIEVTPVPGELASGQTKIAPGAVRLEDGEIVFSFAGVDIPDAIPFEPSFNAAEITDASGIGVDVLTAVDAAAARTAISAVGKGDLVYNVKDYGAVGNGVANDRAAIHAARDAAGVGGTVYFPPGTYLVQMVGSATPAGSGGLHANVADQTWMLGSAELVLTGSAQENLITISAPNVSIIGGTLDLSAIPGAYFFNAGIAIWSGSVLSSTYGAFGSGAAGAVIRDVTINNASAYAVWVQSTNSVTITGCTFRDFWQAAVFVARDLTVADLYDFVIDNNYAETVYSSQAAGFGVGANDQSLDNFDNAVKRYRRVRITNNVSRQPRTYIPGGYRSGCIEMFNVEDAVIAGNITDGGAFGITTGAVRRVTYSGNVCRGWKEIGLEVSGGLEDVVVTGNMLDSEGAGGPFNATTGAQDAGGALSQTISGIMSAGPKSYKNYVIANNVITGFTTAARAGGISLANTSFPGGGTIENVTISGNSITAGGGSAQFSAIAPAMSAENLTITGNTIDGFSRTPSKGIDLLDGATYGSVTISGNSFNDLQYAVYAAGTLSDISVTGNLVKNCTFNTLGPGAASATNLVSDHTTKYTSTATAAGVTILTEASTELQIFTGTTTQSARLPTAGVIAGRRFTIINNSTGDVVAQSSNGSAIETLRATTSQTFVALQNAPTTPAHWQATASGEGSTINRMKLQSLSNRANLVATGPDSTIAVNMICKGASILRLQSDTGYALEAFPVASTANNLQVYSATAGNAPYIIPVGTDAAINLNLRTKSTGVVQANGVEVSTNSTTSTHTVQQIEVGHATDTTLTRSSAGVLAVEGVPLVTTTGTATLSGKSLSSPNIDGGAGTAAISTTSSATDAVLYVNCKNAASVRLASSLSEAFHAVPIASGANYLRALAATTGNAPGLQAFGTDANVNLNLRTLGTGVVQANGVAVSINAITATHTAQQIELGHATDTTITRSAAGVPAVEGNPLGVRVGVPASAAATGAVGQFSTDASWLYVCTATDTWMRVAIATW